MQVQFLGSGDAFGSGGRFHTCFHVTGRTVNFLIDCGASSLIALKARPIDRNAIQAIFVTHFHADHFGGIPFFVLDAQFFSKRTQPLHIVGPQGLATWYQRAMETAFPGSSATKPKFAVTLVELEPRRQTTVADIQVMPFQVNHGEAGGPFLAYRFEAEGHSIAYTGDTEWTDELLVAGHHADLFIAEAYFFDKKVKLHLDLDSLRMHLPQIAPKRLILTHMSDDMLARLDTLSYETAHDGMIVEV